tara:strand:+ start:710 stop:940 length:231 start_codon:yes stop_codon:yes gene_type:complete
MNAIVSISFHTRKHAHVLEIINAAKMEHPNMTRSAIIRSLVIDGASTRIYQEILDAHVPEWRKKYIELIRTQQGQT